MQQTQQQQQTAALVRQLQQQLSSESDTSHFFFSCLLFPSKRFPVFNETSPLFSRYTTRTGHQFILLIMLVHSSVQRNRLSLCVEAALCRWACPVGMVLGGINCSRHNGPPDRWDLDHWPHQRSEKTSWLQPCNYGLSKEGSCLKQTDDG